MIKKNNIKKILEELKHKKMVALVAPSFVVDFDYPKIIYQLRKLGFDKVVELTFGAKMVNREYHKVLGNSKGLVIASACPGIVNTIKNTLPQYKDNLILVDSPMIAMAKICKKHFSKHKTVFISPCDFKKIEAEKSKYVDYVIDYSQLRELVKSIKAKKSVYKKEMFDKFYNDYTKIYPLSGGLTKTAHLKGVIKKNEVLVVDGIKGVIAFLKKPNPKIRFLDVLFCEGGCIGGPYTSKKSIGKKREMVIKYMNSSKQKDIPENRKGLLKNADGIDFSVKGF
jgi:iron only hydrogenase large subunit-like protein